jgi:hypothetical protein
VLDLGLGDKRRSPLGNPNIAQAQAAAAASIKAGADRFAANVLPIIREAQAAGASRYALLPIRSMRAASEPPAVGNGPPPKFVIFCAAQRSSMSHGFQWQPVAHPASAPTSMVITYSTMTSACRASLMR